MGLSSYGMASLILVNKTGGTVVYTESKRWNVKNSKKLGEGTLVNMIVN